MFAQPETTEVVCVDDCSRDGTRETLAAMAEEYGPRLKVVLHEKNGGKGKALRTGFAHVACDVTLVQDADLEYDPRDYPALMRPFADGGAEVVYGSRYLGHEADSLWHVVGNKSITLLSNICTRQHLTDMETCYKAFRTKLLRSLALRQDRFGWDPEVTALVARRGVAIREVPIGYKARSYEEGKKIRLKDLFRVVGVILQRGLLGL